MQQKTDTFIDALHIFVLFSFAVAQPLFDLLSRNAGFFAAHHSEPVDIVVLILILCVLLPALVVLIEVAAGLFGRRARKAVHGFMVAGLVAVIVLPALKKLFEYPGTALLVGAVIVGITATIAYIRFNPLRQFLTVLSPALLIFPGLFLFNSPVFKIVFPQKDPSAITVKLDNAPPIIMVVFDEFPITSLMDEHRQIDPIRYPNFAALARDAYWFRNAISVSAYTLLSLPAILSGSYPDQSRIPTAADYPHSLFTLLGTSYKMKVFESHTMMCPEIFCEEEKALAAIAQRTCYMLLDLSVVYLHIVVPSDLTAGLPVITQTWKDFWAQKKRNKVHAPAMKDILSQARASYVDRAGLFAEFVESTSISDEPTLYFFNSMLPHVPWEYLPSGKVYTQTGMEVPGLDFKKEKWGEDDWLVIQGYQRHLLQVGFVDKLLGALVAELKALNLYDQSLIVITADHGVNFWPNKPRREVLKEHPMDILGIPLFIKAPNQSEGVIYDHNVKTIDILPTIADILDIPLPWHIDGHSALDSSFSGKSVKVIVKHQSNKVFPSSPSVNPKYKSLNRMLTLFGSGTKPDGLFKVGDHNDLVGRQVSKLAALENSGIVIELDQSLLYEYVDLGAPFVPAQITGRIMMSRATEGPVHLALVVNGTIGAVTRTYTLRKGIHRFSAIVPDSSFREGKNDVEVFIVSTDSAGQLNLARARSHRQATYSISSSSKALIRHPDDTSIQIIPKAVDGWVGSKVRASHVYFSGWAADIESSQLAEEIVVFVNGRFLFSGRTEIDRPDVAKHFDNPAVLKTGFKFALPLSLFKDAAITEVRFFAVSKKGVASELNYHKGYKWDKKDVKVSDVSHSHRQFQLTGTKGQSQVTYSFSVSSDRGETITFSNGASIAVIPNALEGFLDIADVGSDRVVFAGWAADITNSQPAETILLFMNGRFLFSGRTEIDRPDVAKHFDNPAVLKTGFKFVLPLSLFKDAAITEVRFFAVSKRGVASELTYPKDYKWGKKS